MYEVLLKYIFICLFHAFFLETDMDSSGIGIMPFREHYFTSSDVFYKLVEAEVKSIQFTPTSQLATKVQEAMAENLKYFLGEVEKVEPLFRVSELIQVGSFAEGTKIDKPDEFDFLAVNDALSKEGTVSVKHEKVPGIVSVTLAEAHSDSILTKLCEEGKVNCFLEPSFSGPERFGTLFVKAVLNAYTNKVFEFSGSQYAILMNPTDITFGNGGLILPPVDGNRLLLNRVVSKISNILLEYKFGGWPLSVDMSPAIRYHKIDDCITNDKCANPKLMEAIRKHGSLLLVVNKYMRVKGFRITVTESEVKYMQDIMEKQHKILYILLKQVCHKFEVSNLRNAFTSYQLKQVCIHHDAKCQVETEKSLDCLENITNNMIKHCTEKYLPSVLNKDVDLFKAFDFSNERGWHFKLHFLIALRLICQCSRNIYNIYGQVSLTATVTCNQYYLLSCGADGAR